MHTSHDHTASDSTTAAPAATGSGAADAGTGTTDAGTDSGAGTGTGTADTGAATAQTYWNGRYNEWNSMWSGRVNPILAREASLLTAGTALDLGCGEGADAIWLAQAGWQVTAIDVSTTALDRAHTHAAAAGIGDRIEWQHHDLAESFPAGEFDLVSAQFLHSPIEMPRGEILRKAAAAVAPGGSLLVVGHFGITPGAAAEHTAAGDAAAAHSHHDIDLPTPEEVLADLDLPDTEWETVVCELVARTATAPDGAVRELVDSILRVQRRPR